MPAVAIHPGVSRINALPPEEMWEKYTMCDDDDCPEAAVLFGKSGSAECAECFLGGLAKDLQAIAAAVGPCRDEEQPQRKSRRIQDNMGGKRKAEAKKKKDAKAAALHTKGVQKRRREEERKKRKEEKQRAEQGREAAKQLAKQEREAAKQEREAAKQRRAEQE